MIAEQAPIAGGLVTPAPAAALSNEGALGIRLFQSRHARKANPYAK
ncbi:hypothetical protein [Bacillus subtilis]|nr:hypothetical protein [Bacillus subtilis]QHQ80958.1 hypothetical protein GPJ55_14800 [Bacillus subtilis]